MIQKINFEGVGPLDQPMHATYSRRKLAFAYTCIAFFIPLVPQSVQQVKGQQKSPCNFNLPHLYFTFIYCLT